MRISRLFRFFPLLVFALFLHAYSEHHVPPEKYGPSYFYSPDPAMRLYKLPFAAGESTHVSDGWRTDPNDSLVGADHPDFAVDLDVFRAGQWCIAARAGWVRAIDEAPGGQSNFCTIWIGRTDSILDSTSTRSNGWRLGQTRDMYRHIVTGFDLKLGDYVEQGAPVAKVIYAPLSSFTHLHFQIDFYINGAKVTVPAGFVDITGPSLSEGFPEIGDTYICQNVMIGVEDYGAKPLHGMAPMALSLFPNPIGASAATSIFFNLKTPQSSANLAIYDVTGRLVERLWSRSLVNPGDYCVPWPAARVANGVYICRLNADGKNVSKRIYRK